ncbi:MAG: RidA family protein [Oscillospiraceae bacterium]|jgi:2-iminobutanoate/2-iminopropanoate deaminase|nr:RidA family protein [Oscillospiraceae bacterium]
MRTVTAAEAPEAIGPYSHAARAGDMIYTSGQIPLLPGTGALADGGIGEQTRQALDNLRAVLRAAGSDLAHVVKTTCFLTDMGDFAAFNEVYAEYFTAKPARSCVAVLALPKGARVEIEAVAEVCREEG